MLKTNKICLMRFDKMAGIFWGLDKKPTKAELILAWLVFVIFAFILFEAIFDLSIDINLIILFWVAIIIPIGIIGFYK